MDYPYEIHPVFGCFEWAGPIDADGYGRRADGKLAHRAIYEEEIGPIPKGEVLDHLCRNRRCVNPSHLESISQSKNQYRKSTGYRMKMPLRCGHNKKRYGRLTPHGGWICKECM